MEIDSESKNESEKNGKNSEVSVFFIQELNSSISDELSNLCDFGENIFSAFAFTVIIDGFGFILIKSSLNH